MKHLQKFEHKFSWDDKVSDKNERIYEYIREIMIEFREKHHIDIYYDGNAILIPIPCSLSMKKDIKSLINDNEQIQKILNEVDYIIEKVCTNEEIDHSVQLVDSHLQLVFYWENESPF